MNLSYIRLLGIVIQSSVIFVGLSVFFGRIYFLSYLDTLGIPESAIDLNVLEYSVVYPHLTSAGIIIVLYVSYIMFMFTNLPFPESRNTAIVGGLITIVGFLLSIVSIILPYTQDVILELAFVVISIALMITGIGLFIRGIQFITIKNDSQKNILYRYIQTGHAQIIFTASSMLIILMITINVIINKAEMDGEIKAQQLISEAPMAQVIVNSSAQGEPEEYRTESGIDIFRVIMFGNDFVYLKVSDTESFSAAHGLHSIPIKNIWSIRYIPQRDLSQK